MEIFKQENLIGQQGLLAHFKQELPLMQLGLLLHIKEGIQVTARYLRNRLTNPDIRARVLDRIVIIIL